MTTTDGTTMPAADWSGEWRAVSLFASGPRVWELLPPPEPLVAAERLRQLPHLLFFDSSAQHPERGRYSYVMAAPTQWLSGRAGADRCWATFQHAYQQDRNRFGTLTADLPSELPPFRGGWAGLFGYGLHRELERVPPARYDEFGLPDLAVGRYEWVLAFDHALGRAWLVDHSTDGQGRSIVATLLQAGSPAGQELAREQTIAATEPLPLQAPRQPLPGWPGVWSNFDRAGYEAAVARAVAYVHAGDCFQVNLSQRLLARLREPPWELYRRLRQCSPAPFAAYCDGGSFQVLSASPERFLWLSRDGVVVTRPIKGTRRRGRNPLEDAALAAELAASPKDRAENVMIVDLLRNDLGKVCVFGSVRASRVCEVETFQQVHHLVSEVRGQLRAGVGPVELLMAAFPGGSVTGAPKVRAMEIIAELEPTVRGPYCGCLGWLGFDGAMDTNILIRTITAVGGWLQFPVGGGIVAESEPAREYEETLHKAAGLLLALEPHAAAQPTTPQPTTPQPTDPRSAMPVPAELVSAEFIAAEGVPTEATPAESLLRGMRPTVAAAAEGGADQPGQRR